MYSLGWNHSQISSVSSRLYSNIYFNFQTVKPQCTGTANGPLVPSQRHIKKIARGGLDSHQLE